MRALLLLAVVLLAAPPAAADEGEAPPPAPDFRVTIAADGAVTIDESGGVVVHEPTAAGDGIRFALTVTDGYKIGEIRVLGAFDVQKVRQIVPLWRNRTGLTDDHFFAEVPFLDFENVPLVNFSGTPTDARLRLGIGPRGDEVPPAQRTLVLQRDVDAPAFTVGEPTNVVSSRGASSFLLTTTTDEFAFADLQIRKVGTDAWVRNPTTIPALSQTFPIQGLDDETDYEYRIVVWDWAGNEAWTETYYLTTPPSPVLPAPVVTIVEPARGATVATDVPTVRVTFASPDSPVDRSGVRAFFDKREISDVIVVDRNVTWTPSTKLASGLHSFTVEVTNAAGGRGSASWTFTVAAATPLAAASLAAVALLAAAAARRAR